MAAVSKYESKAGKVSYRVRWREGGKRDGKWQTATFRRLTDARSFKIRVEAAGHAWPDDTTGAVSAPGTHTVDQLAELYLTERAKRVRSDRTPVDYRRDYDNWVAPTFGNRIADDVSAEDVQEWVDGMLEGTVKPATTRRKTSGYALAPKSIADRHAILSGIYGYAITARLVDSSPCATTRLPKKQKGPPKGLRPMEWTALHAALQQIDPDAADLARFLLATAWRWSEATALTVFDVEDYGHDLYVTMGHVMRRNAAGQHVVVEEGKGQASVRRVKLPPRPAQMIRERIAGKPGDALVFTTRTGAQWHSNNFRDRAWTPAVKAANLTRKPTPHWLRHTAVVWLHQSGAGMAELQARIGHESITTTIGVYGRMLTDVTDETLVAFGDMIDGAAREPLPNTDRPAIGS